MIFTFLKKRSYFCLPFSFCQQQPGISGQRLMMQRRYCALAVEQKKPVPQLLALTDKDTYTNSAPRD